MLLLKEARSKFPIGSEIDCDGYFCHVKGYGAVYVPKNPGRDRWIEAVTLIISGHPFLHSINFEFVQSP